MDVPHFCWLSYKEENAWKVDWCCCAVNGVKRTKIRNPRVYIYRAISVMLTSVCVSFWQPLGAFVASFLPNLTQFEVLELSFQTMSTRRRSCTMSCCWGGWVFRWGGLTKWHQRVGWVVDVRCVPLLACRPSFLGVHSTSWLYARHGSCRPPLARAARSRKHDNQHAPRQPTWEELGF